MGRGQLKVLFFPQFFVERLDSLAAIDLFLIDSDQHELNLCLEWVMLSRVKSGIDLPTSGCGPYISAATVCADAGDDSVANAKKIAASKTTPVGALIFMNIPE
jgi:hypothetical protein